MSDDSERDRVRATPSRRGTGRGWRVLWVLAGAFCAASLAWMLWGVTSSGDFFGGGSPVVLGTLVLASGAGGVVGARLRSRRAQIAVGVGVAACALFWIFTSDGWWAVAPPPRPQQVKPHLGQP